MASPIGSSRKLKRSSSRPEPQVNDRREEPVPLQTLRRPTSASPSCRYEDASGWVKKRLLLRTKGAPVPEMQSKLTMKQKEETLVQIYTQSLKSQSNFKNSMKAKIENRKPIRSQHNRMKPALVNLCTIQALELRLRQTAQFFGYDSTQVRTEARKIVKFANKVAMRLLDKGEHWIIMWNVCVGFWILYLGEVSQALHIFKRAESAGKLYPGLNSLTYNNLSCAHKHSGRLDYALESVESALEIHKSNDERACLINVYVNDYNYAHWPILVLEPIFVWTMA